MLVCLEWDAIHGDMLAHLDALRGVVGGILPVLQPRVRGAVRVSLGWYGVRGVDCAFPGGDEWRQAIDLISIPVHTFCLTSTCGCWGLSRWPVE